MTDHLQNNTLKIDTVFKFILKVTLALSIFFYLNTSLILNDFGKSGQGEKIIAIVDHVYGSAKVREAQSNTWNSLVEGQAIYFNSSIYIGKDSKVGLSTVNQGDSTHSVLEGELLFTYDKNHLPRQKVQLLPPEAMYFLGKQLVFREGLRRNRVYDLDFEGDPKLTDSLSFLNSRTGQKVTLGQFKNPHILSLDLWSEAVNLELGRGGYYANAEIYWDSENLLKWEWNILISKWDDFRTLEQFYEGYKYGSAVIELPKGQWFVKVARNTKEKDETLQSSVVAFNVRGSSTLRGPANRDQ